METEAAKRKMADPFPPAAEIIVWEDLGDASLGLPEITTETFGDPTGSDEDS
jgi:hypothetical protein